MIVTLHNMLGAARTAGDADVLAFIAAVEGGGDTLSSSHKTAINDLVVYLKNNSLWSKVVAHYPIVGGTATAHKWNLKNPAQYALTFVGSPTHNSTGFTTNGTTQYAETGITNANFGGNEGMSFYGIFDEDYLGGINAANQRMYLFIPSLGSRLLFFAHFDDSGDPNNTSSADSVVNGFKGAAKQGSNTHFRGVTLSETKATGADTLTSGQTHVIGALKNGAGAVGDYGAHTFKSIIYTSNMSLADLGLLRTAIVNYNTALGR